jgi:hypothetical protein
MREALLTLGMLLLFAGCMGAIAGSTYMGAGAGITDIALRQMFIAEIISTIIAFAGAILLLRYR